MSKKYTYVEPKFLTHFEVGNKKVNLIQSFEDHIIRIKKSGSVLTKINGQWRRFSNPPVINREIKRIRDEIGRLENEGNSQPV